MIWISLGLGFLQVAALEREKGRGHTRYLQQDDDNWTMVSKPGIEGNN